MPGIPVATDLPRLIYHRRAPSNELLLRAVTGTSFFTIGEAEMSKRMAQAEAAAKGPSN